MPGEEDRTMMEREAAEMMARDFSPYSQRLSSGSTKLGINSNIYSLYQNKQVGARSSLGESGYGMVMSSSLPGRSPDLSKPPAGPEFSSVRQGAESPVESASVYPELGQSVRQAVGRDSSEKLYTACMQERTDLTSRLTNTCREQDTMEPDSSTDSREQADTNGVAEGDEEEEEEEEEVERTEANSDRMQKLLKEHARMFNVKNEPEVLSGEAAKRNVAYRSPQEELAELMKLTNEKLFKSSQNTNKSLPLSVEIDEQDSSCDSVSPPRHPYMVTNSLSPRKRGRKPKHYSEILYELGQRGISITKTSKPSPVAASQSTEMVVSENGAVSHKASGQQLKCPHCNKILTTSVGLMYHIRLHTGQSPVSLPSCHFTSL